MTSWVACHVSWRPGPNESRSLHWLQYNHADADMMLSLLQHFARKAASDWPSSRARLVRGPHDGRNQLSTTNPGHITRLVLWQHTDAHHACSCLHANANDAHEWQFLSCRQRQAMCGEVQRNLARHPRDAQKPRLHCWTVIHAAAWDPGQPP